MTRIDVSIECLVLRGVPAEMADGLGPLVEQRLGELATADRRGEPAPQWASKALRHERPVTDREELAAQVARDTWASSRTSVRLAVPR